MRSGPEGAGAWAGAAAGASIGTALLGTKSTLVTASVGAIGIPLTPRLESGATPSACHCWSSGSCPGRGKDAHATPLQSRASTPALFHPGLGQAGASERRNGCAWLGNVNTPH